MSACVHLHKCNNFNDLHLKYMGGWVGDSESEGEQTDNEKKCTLLKHLGCVEPTIGATEAATMKW